MAAYGYRPRSCNPCSGGGSWSCTPDGVCGYVTGNDEGRQRPITRYNPNNNNNNGHNQQQQCYVMKMETSFEHLLQPHGSVSDSPRTVEDFFTNLQSEASQPSRFQIPISAAPGHHHQEKVTYGEDSKYNKQNRERAGLTHHDRGGGGGWDRDGDSSHQQHQFIDRSCFSNNGDKGGWKKEATPTWTNDPRWLSMRMNSGHDNRLSKPTNSIDEPMELLKELAFAKSQLVPEAKNVHSNSNNNNNGSSNSTVRQEPQSNNSRRGTITSKKAAEIYGGHLVK